MGVDQKKATGLGESKLGIWLNTTCEVKAE